MSIVLRSPLQGELRVTSNFGYREDPITGGSAGHKGTDFGMPEGTPIFAVADGVVIVAKAQNSNNLGEGFGYYVVLDHGGFYSVYAHMKVHPNRYVQLNNKVVAGQQIGIVGTTGRSTGNHLHLEIRIGTSGWSEATPVDPMTYLEGTPLDTTGLPPSSISSGSGSLVNPGANQVPYTPSQIVGRRLSSLEKHPLHAYVNIYIGDKLLTSDPAKPNVIQSFEITRIDGTGDKATFTIFDDNWEEIEKVFSDHWSDVHIQYGYVDSTLLSERYNMMLQDYSISFNSTGVILSVSAISTGTLSNLSPITIVTGTSNPTEAIKIICREIGLVVEDENFDVTIDFPEEINLLNDHPIAYILDEIVGGGALTPDGEILNFHIDSTNRAYLKRHTFIPPEAQQGREIRTYIYQKGYDSVVEDLTFDIKGVFGGTTKYGVASGIQSVFIDPSTKSIAAHKEDTKSTVTAATGEFQSMKQDQSVPYVDPAGYDASQMKSRLYYRVKRDMTEMYEAQMSIIGDPTIRLLDDIRVINVTDEGYLHHTSGIYKVLGIVDSIDGGVMRTSLKLVRNGDINAGVEIINPKTLIK